MSFGLISSDFRVNLEWISGDFSGEFSVRDWFVGLIETKYFDDQLQTAESISNLYTQVHFPKITKGRVARGLSWGGQSYLDSLN